ncbi:MAG TPA: response regulator transcription factor [Usitatibacter sp.]|jgi:DNA-binding response OmpR family regulator|nr:response regulator transcription factor [Usitatibacter sp.]
MRVLYMEDDAIQREVVAKWLASNGHVVVGVPDGGGAIRSLERDTFDLVVLDWNVPNVSGQDVLNWIRQRELDVPVVFATSCGGEFEAAAIFQLGADDYVVKPLRRFEFVARIEALGRRAGVFGSRKKGVWTVGAYTLDPHEESILLQGKRVQLAPRLAKLALYLFRRCDTVVSRAQLYDELWHHKGGLDTRTLDTHICRLRQILELDGRHGVRLASVYQTGYRLESRKAEYGAEAA